MAEDKTEKKARICEIIKSFQETEIFFIFNYINEKEKEKVKVDIKFLNLDEESGEIYFEVENRNLKNLKKVIEFSEKLTLFYPRRSLSLIIDEPKISKKVPIV